MNGRYASILHQQRVYSEKHPQMPNKVHAAQFAPFAAMTGYDEAVIEMARLTTERIVLSDDAITELDRKLQLAQQMIDAEPEITLVYFVPDQKKRGGEYVSKTGTFAGINEYTQRVLFSDGGSVPIQDIYDISGEVFACLDE